MPGGNAVWEHRLPVLTEPVVLSFSTESGAVVAEAMWPQSLNIDHLSEKVLVVGYTTITEKHHTLWRLQSGWETEIANKQKVTVAKHLEKTEAW